MQRNVLVAFLASPSDLQDERALVKETVERINRIFGKTIGWHIDLRGWEDVLPDYRRPQDIINRDVDECELFIGMLWTRWGTPTATFTSGFEEEFERVRVRWLATKQPTVWLLFRSVDPDRSRDAGPQLSQVLAFKQEQIARNELLFKEFETPEQFGATIHDMLTEFLLRLSAKQQSDQEERELSRSPDMASADTAQETHPTTARGDTTQLVELFERTTRALRGPPDDFDLTLDERTRLLVAATAWFSPKHSFELLGIHEVHIAFRHRLDWRHTSAERTLLLRTMVADEHDIRPGWYWLYSQSPTEMLGLLRFLALADRKQEVRRGAVAMCSRLNVTLERADLVRLLQDDEEPVVIASIRLAKGIGSAACEALLERMHDDGRPAVRDAVGAALYDLKFARDPAGAIRDYIARGAKPVSWLTKEQAKRDIPLDAAFMKQALTRPETHVRIFAAEWLRRAGTLDRAGWQQLLNDPEDNVRLIAVEALIDTGETFDRTRLEKIFPSPPYGAAGHSLLGLALLPTVDKDALRARQLRRQSADVLASNLDFYDLEGPLAYDVIGEASFELLEERIRGDLDAEFLTLKRESDARIRAALNEAAEPILSRWSPEVIEHKQNEFIAAALRHLASHAVPTDAAIARRFVMRTRSPKVVAGAAKVLAAIGNPEDAELLLRTRGVLWGPQLTHAVEAAISLAVDKPAFLRRLLDEDDRGTGTIDAIAGALSNLEPSARSTIANEMISSKNEVVRMRGVATILRTLPDNDLPQFLQEYVALDTYYYDVVTWLDRIIYAPEPFRTQYRSELLRTLS